MPEEWPGLPEWPEWMALPEWLRLPEWPGLSVSERPRLPEQWPERFAGLCRWAGLWFAKRPRRTALGWLVQLAVKRGVVCAQPAPAKTAIINTRFTYLPYLSIGGPAPLLKGAV